MVVSELWQQAALGAGGGIGAEILHWYLLSRNPEGIAGYKTGAIYWLTTLFMVAFGAVMPILYLSGSASALLCFHLGAATPLLLQKLVSAAPAFTEEQGALRQVEAAPTLRGFLSW